MALLAALAVVVATVLLLGRADDDPAPRGAATAGAASSLLAVEVTTFEGARVRLERFAGRPLVVNFFASWCGPCAREMPAFAAVHERRGDDVGFVGVSLEDTPGAAMDLVERTGVVYDVVRDTEGDLFRAVGGFAMPTTVFVDGEGMVVEVHGGELSEGGLEARIDRLLGR